MKLRIVSPNMLWVPHKNPKIQAAVCRVLDSWRDTPYESGQRVRELGCDCVGGVFGAVDDLDGQGRAQFPGLPQDASLHSRDTAVAAVRELIRRYSPCHKVEPGDDLIHRVCPGNIVVTGQGAGGPGHVMIVGGRKNELWHALPGIGFHQGGWGLFDFQTLFAIYQIDDDYRWK